MVDPTDFAFLRVPLAMPVLLLLVYFDPRKRSKVEMALMRMGDLGKMANLKHTGIASATQEKTMLGMNWVALSVKGNLTSDLYCEAGMLTPQ